MYYFYFSDETTRHIHTHTRFDGLRRHDIIIYQKCPKREKKWSWIYYYYYYTTLLIHLLIVVVVVVRILI